MKYDNINQLSNLTSFLRILKMKKEYITPRAEKLKFDYTKVVTASYDPTDNPTGKGFADPVTCTSGHPSGKTFPNQKKC